MDYLQPSRVPAAFAAAAASTLFVLIFLAAADLMLNAATASPVPEGAGFLGFVFFIALLHALGVGLPAHKLVAPRWRYSLRAIAPGSFLVGAVPMPLTLFLLFLLTGADAGGEAIEALVSWLALAGTLGMIGLAGGLAFWLIVRGWAED